jgi:hypothetical protein
VPPSPGRAVVGGFLGTSGGRFTAGLAPHGGGHSVQSHGTASAGVRRANNSQNYCVAGPQATVTGTNDLNTANILKTLFNSISDVNH